MAPAGVYTHTYELGRYTAVLPLFLLACSAQTHYLDFQGPDLMWKAFIHASHAKQTVHLAPGCSAVENC